MLVNFCKTEAAARFYRRNLSVMAGCHKYTAASAENSWVTRPWQNMHCHANCFQFSFWEEIQQIRVSSCQQHRLIKIMIRHTKTPPLPFSSFFFFLYLPIFGFFWLWSINWSSSPACHVYTGISGMFNCWPVFGPSCSMRATLFTKLSKLLNKHAGLAEKMTFWVVVYASLKSK